MENKFLLRIIYLTAFVATLAESLIVPFYPQFFNSVFQLSDPLAIGKYLTICRFAFVISFPLWALVSKKISLFRLLIFTQGIAGILGLLCSFTNSFMLFCSLSVLMAAFKSSYMLLYPFAVKLSGKKENVISTTAIIVHSGFILAAITGGLILEILPPQKIFLISALLDFILMSTSISLGKQSGRDFPQPVAVSPEDKIGISLATIAILTFTIHFIMTFVRPFYTSSLAERFPDFNFTFKGFLFIIPSISALLFLPFSKNLVTRKNVLLSAFLVLPISLYLQGINNSLWIEIFARLIYGTCLFVIMVAVDTFFYSSQTGKNTDLKYSYLLGIQNLAYLTAPVLTGKLASHYGYHSPFYVSALLALLPIPILYLFTKSQNYSLTFK